MADTPTDRMDPVLNLLNERPREDWEWRFEPNAIGHSAINAVALGNAALLAYSDQAGVRHFLEKWRLTNQCRRLALGCELSPAQAACKRARLSAWRFCART
jgi:hypothetical protein